VTLRLGSPGDLPFGCWADQGWSAPALAATCTAPGCATGVRWDLLVEASNAPLTWKGETYVGYAVGQATNAADWGTWLPAAPVGPRAGRDAPVPPECAMGLIPACGVPLPDPMTSCPMLRSIREPTVVALTGGPPQSPITSMYVGHAVEDVDTMDRVTRDRFAITLWETSANASDPLDMMEPIDVVSTTLIRPDMVGSYTEDCDSLRDPFLVTPTRTEAGGYWLLYTCCTNDVCSASEIRYIHLRTMLGVRPVAGGTVITASDLGAGYTRVYGPEAVVELVDGDPESATLRLWFLARQSSGRVVVALAQGVTESYRTDAPGVFEFPTEIGLYGANPVLAADDPVVDAALDAGEVQCDRGCDFLGFSVVRDPSTFSDTSRSVQSYRFVVARRVQLTGGGIEYQLVPLDQLWVHP
jgi:hypothetical protein